MNADIPWDPARMEFKPVSMTVTHTGGMRFTADSPGGVTIQMDAHSHLGGSGQIPNPIEYLIASLGGCVGIKILLALKDQNIIPDQLIIAIQASRRQSLPATFDHVHLTISLIGNIDDVLVTSILTQTVSHLCPIAAMFAEVGEVSFEHHITRV